MDFPVETPFEFVFTYDMTKVNVQIRADFESILTFDFTYNDNGKPSKVGILG